MLRAFIITIALLCVLVSQGSSTALGSASCALAIRSNSASRPTEALLSYLSELIERGTIGDKELETMITGLERGVLENPIPEAAAASNHDLLIQREGFQRYLAEGLFDHSKLLTALEQTLEARNRIQKDRSRTTRKTQDPVLRMQFHRVEPGKFSLGEPGKELSVTLTHPIEVMETPVTQFQWAEIMGANPSKHAKGPDEIRKKVKGRMLGMQLNNPVEMVSWWSVLVFANKLSEAHGLMPAYDLSNVQWKKGTSAEDGTLVAESGVIRIVLSNGKSVDPYNRSSYYRAPGYRLPTEAEQEYLHRGGGRANGPYSFGKSANDLIHYSWHFMNSDSRTHPVGQLFPTVVEGKEFFDLAGNVDEWSWNRFSKRQSGGVNPVGPRSEAADMRGTLRGGNFASGSSHHCVYSRLGFQRSPRELIGFRLVRTLDQ